MPSPGGSALPLDSRGHESKKGSQKKKAEPGGRDGWRGEPPTFLNIISPRKAETRGGIGQPWEGIS